MNLPKLQSNHIHILTAFITGATTSLTLGYLYCKYKRNKVLKCQTDVCPITIDEKINTADVQL